MDPQTSHRATGDASAPYGSHPERLADFLASLGDDQKRVRQLDAQENARIEALSLNMLPQTSWGTIDWASTTPIEQQDVDDDGEGAKVFARMADKYVRSPEVFVLWGNLAVPSIALPLELARNNTSDLLGVSHDVWLYAPKEALVIEYFHEGRVTCASVSNSHSSAHGGTAPIEITSYLREGEGDQAAYVAIEKASRPPKDPDYIEGAIELTIHGTMLLDQQSWDYVDQLWAYIARMVHDIEAGKNEAKTRFPDQPIEIRFVRHGDTVAVTCTVNQEVRTAEAPTAELLSTLKQAGRTFFAKLIELVPAEKSRYQEAMRQLGS